MELPQSWKRMKDDLVASTEAWGRGISEEMAFLGSRLKEFWADPEKLISTPAEQGAILPELGLIPQTAVENLKGEKSRALWERIKAGDPEAITEYGMEYMGETGGILRKAAVKKLATTAKGIKAVASGATDPLKAAELRSNVDLTVKEVIPAMRKVKQEIWDPIPDVQWNFFKKDTLGDIDIDKTMLMRLDPRAATGRTVFHEAGGHGLLVRPTEAIKKAQVEYKGELVPATEVMDYIYQVNRSWRGKTDYHTAGWYDKDPAEMLARTVAMDTAKGKDIEQAFLDRLPRVVNAFERTHPEVAEHYRTPLLERVAMKEFEKEMEELPLLIQPKGAPKGKLPPVEERDFVTRMLRELKTSGAEWEANRLSRVKELPKALKKYIVNWDTADVMANFDVLTEATEPTVKGVAPKAKTIEQYYRPANRLSDGTVVWDKWARTHREALDANVGKAKGKRVVSSGGLDPEGNYWEFNFLGDEIPEGIIGKDYLIKGLPKKGFFD